MESEWNTDSFQFDIVTLHRRCASTASRLQTEAKILGEECDVTAERLENLYRAQRGRCAILGEPLTPGKGRGSSLDDPWVMELDHIKEVRYLASRSSKGRLGGHVGLMSNVRWVSRIGHAYRHFAERKGVSLDDVALMVRRVLEHGAPWNGSVDVMGSGGATDCRQQKLEEVFSQFRLGGEFFPCTKRLTEEALSRGIYACENDFVRLFRRLGVDPRKLQVENRKVALRRFFVERPDVLLGIDSGTQSATDVHSEFSAYLQSLGLTPTSDTSFRQYDLYPFLRETGRVAGVRSPKLRHWAVKDTCTWRTRIRDVLKDSGDVGASAQSVCDVVLRDGRVAGVCAEDVRKVLESMVARRMADVRADGMYVARLTVYEAAVLCGLTVNTMRKYHKHGKGPSAEIGQAAKGVACLTYSVRLIREWKQIAMLSGSVRTKTALCWESQEAFEVHSA
jgi:hypothetical protein